MGFSPPSLAAAKINLCLHVTGRRGDGYHLLDSLVVFAGIGDRIDAEPDDTLTLTVTGPFAAGLDGEADNLVLRAARALAGSAGIVPRARLTLQKHLPVASGIGGGSADAAAALRVLALLWGANLEAGQGHALAEALGADVPVCLDSRPARMTGIGERLHHAPVLPGFGLVLVNPGVAVSTPSVFRARAAPFSPLLDLPAAWETADAMANDLAGLRNDLEDPAIALCPAIAATLTALRATPGILLARMSGSGATCFGLTRTGADASRAAAALAALPEAQGWWCWGGPPLPFTGIGGAPNDGSDWGVAKR